jgi:hypothetical protein
MHFYVNIVSARSQSSHKVCSVLPAHDIRIDPGMDERTVSFQYDGKEVGRIENIGFVEQAEPFDEADFQHAQEYLSGALRDVCGRMEAGIFTDTIQTDSGPGTATYTTGPAMSELTMESLTLSLSDRAYLDDRDHFTRMMCGVDSGSGDRSVAVLGKVDADGSVTVLGNITGFQIRTSEYMGEPCFPRNPPVPVMKPGPYLKRRIRRWGRAHPNRTRGKGEYWLIADGNAIMCHPDDLAKLKAAL